MTVIAGISYATLIFSGALGGQLQLGIAAALICATVIGLVVALQSSSPYVIAGPDANISAIMALIAAAVASRHPAGASAEYLSANLWATMVACSLLAGVFLFLVGRFRLGHWIRHIPYPVVGGFLAGTGWLLAHAALLIYGLSIPEAIDKGWLLSAFPRDLVWRTYGSLSFSHIDVAGLTAGAGNLIIIGMWGFLPGVGIGLVIACMMFAFNYSRINVVKHALSGDVYHSNVERSYDEKVLLKDQGRRIIVLRLQGFIFFGSAYPLLMNVQQMLGSGPKAPARYLVLDFSAVSGLDSSSVLSLRKMKDAIRNAGAVLLLVGLRTEVRRLLIEGECSPAGQADAAVDTAACREFADLDYAVGWCEEQILAVRAEPAAAPQHITDHLASLFPRPELIPRLMKYLQRIDAAPGQVLYLQGQPSRDLYFLESGLVTALLELPGERTRKRLRTMSAGTVVGEMGLYLGTPRSATVVAEQPAVLYSLSVESLAAIEAEDLELASALHRFFVRLLASRLTHTNEELAHSMS